VSGKILVIGLKKKYITERQNIFMKTSFVTKYYLQEDAEKNEMSGTESTDGKKRMGIHVVGKSEMKAFIQKTGCDQLEWIKLARDTVH
jgi:hypothetical protein